MQQVFDKIIRLSFPYNIPLKTIVFILNNYQTFLQRPRSRWINKSIKIRDNQNLYKINYISNISKVDTVMKNKMGEMVYYNRVHILFILFSRTFIKLLKS